MTRTIIFLFILIIPALAKAHEGDSTNTACGMSSGGMMNMMGSYNMMGGAGGSLWQALSLISWVILIVIGILTIVWLWKKINKK